jgi:hypothetical protein
MNNTLRERTTFMGTFIEHGKNFIIRISKDSYFTSWRLYDAKNLVRELLRQ